MTKGDTAKTYEAANLLPRLRAVTCGFRGSSRVGLGPGESLTELFYVLEDDLCGGGLVNSPNERR